MPSRGLLILIGATIAAVVAAAMAVSDQYRDAALEQREGALVFADLHQAVNAIATIEVTRAGGKFTLRRDLDGWSNMGAGGFPAWQTQIEKAIGGLAGLTYFDGKTSRTELHAKLHVEDVTEGSESTQLTVKNTGGATVADVIIGKRKVNVAGLDREGVYVRLPGDQRAWLAEGALDVRYDAADWSRRNIVDVSADAVSGIRVEHADGEIIDLHRVLPRDAKLALKNLPDNAEVEHQFQIDYMAGMFDDVAFDDARRADDIAVEKDFAVEATVRSVDGLVVKMRMTDTDDAGHAWALIAADVSTGSEATAQVEDEARRINTELAGWAFKLPRTVTERLTIRLSDIVRVN